MLENIISLIWSIEKRLVFLDYKTGNTFALKIGSSKEWKINCSSSVEKPTTEYILVYNFLGFIWNSKFGFKIYSFWSLTVYHEQISMHYIFLNTIFLSMWSMEVAFFFNVLLGIKIIFHWMAVLIPIYNQFHILMILYYWYFHYYSPGVSTAISCPSLNYLGEIISLNCSYWAKDWFLRVLVQIATSIGTYIDIHTNIYIHVHTTQFNVICFEFLYTLKSKN